MSDTLESMQDGRDTKALELLCSCNGQRETLDGIAGIRREHDMKRRG